MLENDQIESINMEGIIIDVITENPPTPKIGDELPFEGMVLNGRNPLRATAPASAATVAPVKSILKRSELDKKYERQTPGESRTVLPRGKSLDKVERVALAAEERVALAAKERNKTAADGLFRKIKCIDEQDTQVQHKHEQEKAKPISVKNMKFIDEQEVHVKHQKERSHPINARKMKCVDEHDRHIQKQKNLEEHTHNAFRNIKAIDEQESHIYQAPQHENVKCENPLVIKEGVDYLDLLIAREEKYQKDHPYKNIKNIDGIEKHPEHGKKNTDSLKKQSDSPRGLGKLLQEHEGFIDRGEKIHRESFSTPTPNTLSDPVEVRNDTGVQSNKRDVSPRGLGKLILQHEVVALERSTESTVIGI